MYSIVVIILLAIDLIVGKQLYSLHFHIQRKFYRHQNATKACSERSKEQEALLNY